MMATAVVVGTVIGSGVFKKPAVVAENVPYFGLAAAAWIACGVLAMLGALAYAEVATLYPKAGGNYVFLREGYGRLAGFLWGWVEFFIIRAASLAALATIFTQSLYAVLVELAPSAADTLSYWPQRILTVSVIMILALVNARGVRWGGGLQLFITIVKVASLLLIMALPFIAVLFVKPDPPQVDPEAASAANLSPIWPSSWNWELMSAFTSALLAVLWAYHGWQNIAPVAEEVKNPQRNIPLSLLAGVGIVIFLYLGANLAYSVVLPADEMKEMQEKEDKPPAEDKTVAIGFSRRLIGPIGVALAAAAVMISVFGALNGNLLVGPRLLYAMGEDGLAPKALGAVHATYRTPALAIIVMATWSSILVLGAAVLTKAGALDPKKDHFDVLTNFCMFGAVIFETMAVMSIFIFRRKYPDAPRTYRCWGYPWVPLAYVILPAMILANMFVKQQMEAGIGVGFIAAGVMVYFVGGLNRTTVR